MAFSMRRAVVWGIVCLPLFAPRLASAGWPFTTRAPFSRVTWEEKAAQPTGARQWYLFGKVWPPRPRPVGDGQSLVHIYHHAHYWPHPYSCWDQNYIRLMTQVQQDAGWKNATTLHSYHFDADTQELNNSGIMHLQWILESAPQHYRFAYVQSGFQQSVNQARLESVHRAAAEMVGEANVPPIELHMKSPDGRPALEVQRIREAELTTIPRPRIRYQSNATGGGGGGGASN